MRIPSRCPVSSPRHLTVPSAENGRAVHLLKPSTKKRKRKPEVEEEKIERESSKRKLREYDVLAHEYQRQQDQIVRLEHQKDEMEAYMAQQNDFIQKQMQENPAANNEVSLAEELASSAPAHQSTP